MEPRLSFVTLGVVDLKRATDFYAGVLGLPQIKTPPAIAFFELERTYLALYPRVDLAADAGLRADAGLPDPGPPVSGAFPGFTLAHNVARRKQSTGCWQRSRRAEDASCSRAARSEFNGYSGYFADPDGFLWEVALQSALPAPMTVRRESHA